MESAQKQALENLSHYLSADYMDVYVATSMRTESDFVSVNRFVERLFSHSDVEPLRLRYFNPTQSWIEDRVAKGLVEALMLRRSLVTLYMAQKSDSFGKDSEASVALGQGKAVIVYVPKLSYPDGRLDSEELLATSDARLREILADSYSVEELDEFDHDGLFSAALAHQLNALSDGQMLELVELHWADLALADESERIVARPDERDSDVISRRKQYSEFVAGVAKGRKPVLNAEVRRELEKIVCAVVTNFELRRARVFKDVHPLALQVIVSSGIINGILVSRSLDSCASLLRGVLENSLELEYLVEDDNYRLIEKTTGSTVRVIARNRLVASAFERVYLEE